MKTNIPIVDFSTELNALMKKYKVKEIHSEKGTSSSIKRVEGKIEIIGMCFDSEQ